MKRYYVYMKRKNVLLLEFVGTMLLSNYTIFVLLDEGDGTRTL